MKRWTIVVVAAISAAAPSVAVAQSPTRQDMAVYHRLYDQAAKRFGKLSGARGGPGCELGRTCHQAVTHEALVASEAVLRRMVYPASSSTSYHPVTYQPVHHYYHSSYSHSTYHSSYSAPVQSAPVYSSGSSGGGYCGAYQFDQSTWSSVGMSGSPCGASPAQQDAAAQKLYAQRGSQPWPVCGRFAPNWAAVRQCENSGSYAP